MATPDLALLQGSGYRKATHDSSELVCSYDLDGNIIEINAAWERMSGYSRAEALHMNLQQFFEPESWEVSRQQIREQLGGGLPQSLQANLVTKDGQRLLLEITRRLLFEQGQPVAVLDSGRSISDGAAQKADALEEAEARLSIQSMELARFTEHLKQLHRLSTSSYPTLERAFEDHLTTGSQLLGLPVAAILRVEGNVAVVHASQGSESLPVGAEIPLRATHCLTVAGRLRTMTASEPVPGDELCQEFEVYIGTPIWIGSELFGILSFSSAYSELLRAFTSADKEVIELMARSIGRCVLEHRVQSERRKSEILERSRNRVLEMVAKNRDLEAILEQVVYMVEGQRPEALCSVLLLKDELLTWTTAPSFPPQTIRLLKPVRVLRDASDLVAAEVARSIVFWDEIRQCPFWSERSHFAGRIGIESCLSGPIRAANGALLGIVALHYRNGQRQTAEDRDLLQLAGRLAAIAIEQRRLTEVLEFQARHDSLTTLPNRSYFLELLKEALGEASERSGTLAVLFVDLDRFKQINDTLGHAMGDRLLKEVGERLKRLLTEDDMAGRMGGDEFTIVLTRQPDEQTAIQASREFLNAFRAPHRIDEHELFVTASIGVAIFPTHGRDSAELMRNADLAMYHAKNNGKNDVEVFRAEDHASGLERLRLENALRRALENDEFELLYQPVVAMDGKVDGLEALLTWRHPVYGTISPNQFIPIAEETGLIIEFGSWVIRQACLEARRWHEAGHSFVRVSVNVSALQFERRDFVETVATALALSGLAPECLELELTESYIMRDLAQAVDRLAQIRDLGVSIAIDDFGTGYSSLSYLNRLPVDSLKIDQSFLRSLHEPEGSLPVVQGIVRLAHSMNLVVVAEGVETRQELDLVRVLGCDKVQGHVYGPALRCEEVDALLARKRSLVPVGG
jgi:diguanylate cyclase (GGDEF)-like protein/PAS domain S-box-containing protein